MQQLVFRMLAFCTGKMPKLAPVFATVTPSICRERLNSSQSEIYKFIEVWDTFEGRSYAVTGLSALTVLARIFGVLSGEVVVGGSCELLGTVD